MSESTVPNALLVEDEPQIRRFVRSALEEEGWHVFEADSLKRGLIDTGTRKPDLIVLDLGLPDGDGLDFIKDIRQWSSVPIIVLSARTGDDNKIKALDFGADDYLSKPFSIGELLARVRSTMRRHRLAGTDLADLVQFGDVQINRRARLVTKQGKVVHLTPIEYRLLTVLVINAGRVVCAPQLLRDVWGVRHLDNAHYLRIYMGHLRQKLEDDPTQPAYFVTETGVGYRLHLEIR